MAEFFLCIYNRLRSCRRWTFAALAAICALLLAGALSLRYNENILDFLPFGQSHRKALNLYQQLSSADRIFAIVQHRDSMASNPERLTEAVDRFAEAVRERDSLHSVQDLTTRIDYGRFSDCLQFIYDHIPYFLTEADYGRIDSLLSEEYISARIADNRMMLLFPAGSALSGHIRQDPLHLFSPVVSRLQTLQGELRYELYDGYILSPDRHRAIVMMRSPYGSNETNSNSRLIALLNDAAAQTESQISGIEIHLSGAPVIAVTNARQIKIDSAWSIAIAVILILALLLYSFRSLRSLFLIGVSILFGWLFALGCLSLIRDEVSMIILGIASIIIGIAVNYPLHLLAHLRHAPDVRSALREIVSPLLIGNITTVGAFLCLVPMTAPALRDLGLFASFMLVGTILFVVIFLPHLVKSPVNASLKEHYILRPLSRLTLDNKPWILLSVCLLTGIFAYFSQYTAFDTEMQHINYMTDEQRADLKALGSFLGESGSATVYVASEGAAWDEALQANESAHAALVQLVEKYPGARLKRAAAYLPSQAEQIRRLERWERFVEKYGDMLHSQIAEAAVANGFREDAFADFESLLRQKFRPMPWEQFSPLAEQLFSGYVCQDNGIHTVVDRIDIGPEDVESIEAALHEILPEACSFDVHGINRAVSRSLTDDFNYICWSCGLIVFFFLWFSFGRLELSLLAFLPMAVSWLWILGIMELTDIRFNIVNIILATFIFGQGDDYTIFMTEGLIYEYAYGRKLLHSYKNSIILSALIMLIGIGTLIISKHPAMHSLAEVTIVGMFAVVLMACILPPFIYNRLVRDRSGNVRPMPITIGRLVASCVFRVSVWTAAFIGVLVSFCTGANSRILRRYGSRSARIILRLLIGVKYQVAAQPAVNQLLLARYHSDLDFFLLLSTSPCIVIATDQPISMSVRLLLHTTGSLVSPAASVIRHLLDAGCHVVLFLNENSQSPVEQETEMSPVCIHGSDAVLPTADFWLRPGTITIEYGQPDQAGFQSAKEMTALIRTQESDMRRRHETASYFLPQILSRYLYKGPEVEIRTRRLLKRYDCFRNWIDRKDMPTKAVIVNNGQGELGLLFALVHPQTEVYAYEQSPDMLALARNVAALPENLHLASENMLDGDSFSDAAWYLFRPSREQRSKYEKYSPMIID